MLNRFAALAQTLEAALGLGGKKTSKFIEDLAKELAPSLNRLKKRWRSRRGKFSIQEVQSIFSQAYADLFKKNKINLADIQPILKSGKEILKELIRPEELLPHFIQFGQKYWFSQDWDSPIDEFGQDPHAVEAAKPLLQFFYNDYWRVKTHGIKNIPTKGNGMIVANHSGTLPYDGAMIGLSILNEHPKERLVRFLVEDFVYHFPFLGTFLSRIGAVRACPENATYLLKKGELITVFPEGVKGLGKPYKERYQLQRFGRGGYIRLAIRNKTPIIPTAVIGAEEIHPIIWKSDLLAKSMKIPYLPVTPTFPWLGPLGLVPLPTQWQIIYGKPISFKKYKPKDADDNLLVHELSEKVRRIIQN